MSVGKNVCFFPGRQWLKHYRTICAVINLSLLHELVSDFFSHLPRMSDSNRTVVGCWHKYASLCTITFSGHFCLLAITMFISKTNICKFHKLFQVYWKLNLTLNICDSRTQFYEMRLTLEHLCNNPRCPQFVRNLGFKSVAFISRLAPQVSQ